MAKCFDARNSVSYATFTRFWFRQKDHKLVLIAVYMKKDNLCDQTKYELKKYSGRDFALSPVRR